MELREEMGKKAGGTCVTGARAERHMGDKVMWGHKQESRKEQKVDGTEETVKETPWEKSRELRHRSFQVRTARLSFSPA